MSTNKSDKLLNLLLVATVASSLGAVATSVAAASERQAADRPAVEQVATQLPGGVTR